MGEQGEGSLRGGHDAEFSGVPTKFGQGQSSRGIVQGGQCCRAVIKRDEQAESAEESVQCTKGNNGSMLVRDSDDRDGRHTDARAEGEVVGPYVVVLVASMAPGQPFRTERDQEQFALTSAADFLNPAHSSLLRTPRKNSSLYSASTSSSFSTCWNERGKF